MQLNKEIDIYGIFLWRKKQANHQRNKLINYSKSTIQDVQESSTQIIVPEEAIIHNL